MPLNKERYRIIVADYIFHFTNSLLFGSRNTLFNKLGSDYSKHSSDLFSLTSQTLISTTHLFHTRVR